MNHIKIVVGDCFANLRDLHGYILYHDWRHRQADHPNHEEVYFPGQGLDSTQLRLVLEHLPQSLHRLTSKNLATSSQTHKRVVQNILISDLEEISEYRFNAKLIVQDQNELMLDHNTGFHLQGMLFLEATRQITAAAVALMESDSNVYYVMHDIYSKYLNFAFPIETLITLELFPMSSSEGQKAFSVKVDFSQNGKTLVTTGGSFSSVNRDDFLDREARFARISTDRLRRRIKKLLPEDSGEETKVA